MVVNIHERALPVPVDQVGPLLDRLGGPADVLWPSPAWQPMVLDRPVGVGAAGGHGPFRYRVTAHQPGRRIEFTLEPGHGVRGTHTFTAAPVGAGRTVLSHVADAEITGAMRVLWPLAVRWLHDAVVEDLLDRAEAAVGTGPVRPARWSPWVRFLHAAFGGPRAAATRVPATPLLADALARVDWADAHAVACRPGLPTDPQVWADAVFRDPPRWVLALLGLREALVGLVGIARGGSSSFDTVARREGEAVGEAVEREAVGEAVEREAVGEAVERAAVGEAVEREVLLGTDERHLDFRASVLREPGRVVVSTVVRLHNARGRAYFALVKPAHPVIVRAMLTRAARRLADRSAPDRHGAQWSG